MARFISAIFFCFLLLLSSKVQAQNWQIIKEESSLGFVGKQLNADFEGVFEEYSADIYFDPNDLPKTKIKVLVNLGSINTGSVDRDNGVKEDVWFDLNSHPQATLLSDHVVHLEGDNYQLYGRFTLKGITRDIVIPFTFVQNQGVASVYSDSFSFDRTEYKVGTGEWSDESVIGHMMTVVFDLKARPQ